MADPIQLLIADDHPIVRDGLCRSIEEDAKFKIVAQAGDGEASLAFIQQLQPDIAVLDINMPKLDGFEVARRVASLGLKTRIIFLTLHKDQDFFRTAINLGVKGYLLKDSVTQEILAGVQAVAEGRLYVSPSLATHLIEPEARPLPSSAEPSLAQLTITERRILKLISLGKSSKEIGTELSIHHRTVENHRTNICRKLGLEGANALVRFTLQHKPQL